MSHVRQIRIVNGLLAAALVAIAFPNCLEAKSYSSGGGRSYSSSSSHSSSSGGGHSFGSSSSSSHSSGGTHSSSASSGSKNSGVAGKNSNPHNDSNKSFSSKSGRSYSSGSNWSDENRRSYSSGKSYTAGGTSPSKSEARSIPANPQPSSFQFDTAAARARKEQGSEQAFSRFKESSTPRPRPADSGAPAAGSYRVTPPPLPPSATGSYRQPDYVPDSVTILSRPARSYNVFYPYVSRPVVVYRDPYNSFFWWWLLDRSLDDRAAWAYHHRYDMDPARYQTLVAHNRQLEERIAQLETEQTARDPNYVPPGLQPDLMYSDRHVTQAYSNRPTASGKIAFWMLAIPLAAGGGCFLIWLVFFKRWQPAMTA